ncbi:hypothetical protein [Arsenicicoccus sp. oral taxon 190]|uniref:hypothetical protein n=1 Tax=Arsenicicoccus sp. oral taxon 190 TaxID=1658671 RepID=UPI000AEA49CD|nr:hypothetical protein [Arsenicicoccus sp. oral taxon 190]
MTRRHRRVDAPGTGAAARIPAGEPEPRLDDDPQSYAATPPPEDLDEGPDEHRSAAGAPPLVVGRGSASTSRESERDRWLREQRPPHWG